VREVRGEWTGLRLTAVSGVRKLRDAVKW